MDGAVEIQLLETVAEDMPRVRDADQMSDVLRVFVGSSLTHGHLRLSKLHEVSKPAPGPRIS